MRLYLQMLGLPYYVSIDGVSLTGSNPEITLVEDETYYIFNNSSSSHPIKLANSSNTNIVVIDYNETNEFQATSSFVQSLTYVCTNHPSMTNSSGSLNSSSPVDRQYQRKMCFHHCHLHHLVLLQ